MAALVVSAGLAPLTAGRLALAPPARGRAAAGHPEVVARAGRPPARGRGVTFDRYSLEIGGRRLFVWAGELDYWRLPSPSLWLERLQTMRALGYNAVSVYFNWAYHSPAPGVYDFSGVRDVGLFLRMAKRAGLYVIARPGPYISAAADSGGLPGWVDTEAGRSRSSAPDYTAAYLGWLRRINPIIAANQVSRGGSVILYQVENEYDFNVDPRYMEEIEAEARADGITVPMFTNDCCSTGRFASGPGAPALYATDSYPQRPSICGRPDVWGAVPSFFAEAGKVAAGDPKFLSELQGGFYDGWRMPAGDACQYAATGPSFVNVFDEAAIGQGATVVSTYMAAGGVDWGWLAYPGAGTDADQGAGITATGQLTGKAGAEKLLGYLVGTLTPLARTDPLAARPSANPAVAEEARIDRATGTEVYELRPRDLDTLRPLSTHISIESRAGDYPVVPQQPGTAIQLDGRQSRLLVAGYRMGGQLLVYSTSELLTHERIGRRDLAVLYQPAGQDGETVLRYRSKPRVRVVGGPVARTWDARRGDLRLDYVAKGLAQVRVSGGGRPALLLLLASRAEAEQCWEVSTAEGPALVVGPYLVWPAARVTSAGGRRALQLRGQADRAGPVTVFAPPGVSAITWNGRPVHVRPTATGGWSGEVPGPAAVLPVVAPEGVAATGPAPPGAAGSPVVLPQLARWRFHDGAPEAQPGFDDSGWRVADRLGPGRGSRRVGPVLAMDDYGFHYGDVWYRGRFRATGRETAITVDADTPDPRVGAYSVWLDGTYLGTATDGAHTFAFPPGDTRPGRVNVVAVLVESMGHPGDALADDANKSPVGLSWASLDGSRAPITWRIQGGLATADPVRGPFDTGGLYGQLHGWTLPGYPDGGWAEVTLPDTWASRGLPPGIGWYRTTFELHLPHGQDTPVGLAIGGRGGPARALLFLNGWLMGRYAAGHQDRFYLPAGVLDGHGPNTLAIACWGEGPASDGLGAVSLFAYGTYTGGLHVTLDESPGYR